MRFLGILLVVFLPHLSLWDLLYAQQPAPPDSVSGGQDTTTTEKPKRTKNPLQWKDFSFGDSVKDPRAAVLYSAVLPGLGQIYNHQLWKVPILYAGIGATVYAIQFNQKEYSIFKKAYLFRTDNDSATIDEFDPAYYQEQPLYTTDGLKILANYYRRNRDLSYIFLGIEYAINLLDAFISAHLFSFDVGDNLSLKIMPSVTPIGLGKFNYGATFYLRL